jgi:hypothetical protein
MKILVKQFLVFSFLLLSAIFQSASAAPQWTKFSQLYTVDSGWAADTYSVRLATDSSTGIYTNPAGCAFPQAGYVTLPTDPGRKLYQDQLREAFLRGYSVRLLINDTDCPFNKPRIISVSYCRTSTGLTC